MVAILLLRALHHGLQCYRLAVESLAFVCRFHKSEYHERLLGGNGWLTRLKELNDLLDQRLISIKTAARNDSLCAEDSQSVATLAISNTSVATCIADELELCSQRALIDRFGKVQTIGQYDDAPGLIGFGFHRFFVGRLSFLRDLIFVFTRF